MVIRQRCRLPVAFVVAVVGALLACKKASPKGESTGEAASASAPGMPAAPATAGPRSYISSKDVERVCNGEPIKEAAAYDGARGRVHPTAVFTAKFAGGSFSQHDDESLDEWKAKDNKDYELVLCVTTARTTLVKKCELETTSGMTRTLELQDASYDAVLLEAKTARQVAKKSAALKVERQCPSGWVFRHSRDEKRPDPLPTLMRWAKQYAAPD